MKLSITRLLQMQAVISSIMTVDAEKRIDIAGPVRYTLSFNLNKITSALKTYNNERTNLIKELGQLDKLGNHEVPVYSDDTHKVVNPNYITFAQRVKELQDIEEEVPLRTIKEADVINSKDFPMAGMTGLMEVGLLEAAA